MIKEVKGCPTCTKCGYEWSATLGDKEIPLKCECEKHNKKTISKIKLNRKKLYKSLYKKMPKDSKVYSSTEKEIGFIIGETKPYTGEAGYSTKVKVIWKDGSMTKCCLKGMKKIKYGWKILK